MALNKEKIRANLICAVAVFFFACGFPAAEALLKDWEIILLLVIRNVSAFLIIFIIWLFLEGKVVVKQPHLWRGTYTGALGFGLGSSLLVVAQYLTNPVTAALAAAMMPLTAVLLELLLDNRIITKWFSLGVFSVILGGIVSLGTEIFSSKLGVGAILGLFSAIIFAWGSRHTIRVLPELPYLTQTMITTFGMVVFSVVSWIVVSFLGSSEIEIPDFKVEYIYLIIIYSCFGLALSQIFWIKAVGELGVGIASFHMNSSPFFVMILMYILGATWSWSQLTGVILVVFGIIISQIRVEKK